MRIFKMNKEERYGHTIKPLLKRMYELERERKAINKEFRELTQKIRGLNSYLLNDENKK
jgi:prefoldin subunit 5